MTADLPIGAEVARDLAWHEKNRRAVARELEALRKHYPQGYESYKATPDAPARGLVRGWCSEVGCATAAADAIGGRYR